MQIQSDSGIPVIERSKDFAIGDLSGQPLKQAKEQVQADAPRVENSVSNVKKSLELMKETNFQVEYDQDIDRVIVKYMNTYGEVMRQVPTQDFVEFEKAFIKTIGLLFDQKA